jgi:hypothetical protein
MKSITLEPIRMNTSPLKRTMNAILKLPVLKLVAALWLLALLAPWSSPAQSVFQATLATPPDGARLVMGRFYFQMDHDELEFVAIVFPFGSLGLLSSNVNPVLSVPGRSVEFSLGQGILTEFRGLYSYADHNPFLPFELPFLYDEEGNPYLIDAPVIRYGYRYSGRFKLPSGFERQLLTGLGVVELNEYVAGSVRVAAVEKPGNQRR